MDLSKHGCGLGSIVLSLVALLLNIISLATVGWMSGSIVKSSDTGIVFSVDFYGGLWQSCVKYQVPDHPELCGSTASKYAANLNAARALEILAMVVGIFVAVLTASLVFKFLEKALKATKVTSFMTRPKVLSVISIVPGLLTLGALIAYGIDYGVNTPTAPKTSNLNISTNTDSSLYYSFYLSIVATVAYIANGILLCFVKVDSEE